MRHPHRIASVALLSVSLAVAALAGVAVAQERAPDPRATFEGLVEVSEVFLDVLVTDPAGATVPDLAAEDFVVEEDGRPVEVTGVEFYPTRYGVADTAGAVPASRYFVVFVHDQTRFGYYGGDLVRQQMRLGAHLRSWILGGMLPSDWMAVVSYGTRLHLHQDFTQDRDALAAAVDDAVAGRRPRPSRTRGGSGPLGVLARLPDPAERRAEVEDVYDALRLVGEAMGYLVGRKEVLLFTAGIGRRVGAGRRSVLDPHEAPALEAALNDHNVAVYPIDTTPPGTSPGWEDALRDLAARTGGVYHGDFVGFASPVEEISAESAGYYLVSYVTTHPAGEVGYQRVTVRTLQEDLVVRARGGYRYGR